MSGPYAGTVVILNRGQVAWDLAQWMRTLPPSIQTVGPRGNQIARQRNLGVLHTESPWVLFVDSDCVPRFDTLDRLLAWHVDLVGAVVLERFPPHRVTAVKSLDPPARWLLRELPLEGLEPVIGVGSGCTLVRRSVFERMDTPWYRCGQVPGNADLLLEDFEFCLRAKAEAGVQCFLDCGARVGHVAAGVIWPGRDGREWMQWDGPTETMVPVEDIAVAVEAWA